MKTVAIFILCDCILRMFFFDFSTWYSCVSLFPLFIIPICFVFWIPNCGTDSISLGYEEV